ncbi:MAG: hypothetical protein H6657_24665 [Ardenticatenaceae bacterium]|nr:hypothetical protein [Ardenticatenaceae bacterium]
MDTLTIEPTYRVVLGDVNRFRIMVVGAGCVDNHLARREMARTVELFDGRL